MRVALLVALLSLTTIHGLDKHRHHHPFHRFEELRRQAVDPPLKTGVETTVGTVDPPLKTGVETTVGTVDNKDIVNVDHQPYFPDIFDDLQEQYNILKSSDSQDLNAVPDVNGDGERDFDEYLSFITAKIFPTEPTTSPVLLETGAISFCMRRWCDRGAGEVPNTCDWGSASTPAKTEQSGLLCYAPCAAGYVRWGFRCYHSCANDPLVFAFVGYQPFGLGLCHGPGGVFDLRKRPSYSQVGEPFGCGLAQGGGHNLKMDYEAGLCYKQCPVANAAVALVPEQGFESQVTMCRQQCPAGAYKCGMFCFMGAPGDNLAGACTARMLMISAKIVAVAIGGGVAITTLAVGTGGALAPAAAIIATALAGATIPHEFLQVGWCGALVAGESLVNEVVGGAAGGPITQYAVPPTFADTWKCQY